MKLIKKMNNETEQIFLLNTSDTQSSNGTQKPIESASIAQVNLENVEDFSNVCRTCATITEFVIPIFEGEGLQNELADKIHKHLPIQVSEQDALPRVVCYQCASTLLAWHELVKCAVQAEEALRTRLARVEHEKSQSISQELEQTKEKEESIKWNTCRGTYDPAPPAPDIDRSPASDGSAADDEPLSKVATKKSAELYNHFYRTLLKFREHFVTHHAAEPASSSSDSPSSDDTAATTDVSGYDDLTPSNLRRDQLDERTRQELAAARTREAGRVLYACGECGKRLSSPHTFVFHRRIHTGERPCVCHVCGKQFRAPNGLQRHLAETHERVRRHACRYCPKSFANSQNVKQHERTHTGERPYACATCGKRFTQSGSLHAHAATHGAARPHACADCGARFRRRAGLARHRLRHSGERPHACACGRAFRQRHELTAHAAAHAAARPHACALCAAAFRQRRALRHHTARVHAAAPPPPPPSPPPPPLYSYDLSMSCTCGWRAARGYHAHLVAAHAAPLFRCDDCRSYVHTRHLLRHMSLHAQALAAPAPPAPPAADFSDRSDSEYDFGPLPESVFEAIEDSQDALDRMLDLDSEVFDDDVDPAPDPGHDAGPAPPAPCDRPPSAGPHADAGDPPPSQPDPPAPAPEPSEQVKRHKRPRTCPHCGKVYAASSSYFYHLKHAHGGGAREHACGTCGARFATRGALRQHAATHSRARPHACRTCGARFRTRGAAAAHGARHGPRAHACGTCGAAFGSRAGLARHARRHGARALRCAACPARFSLRADLARHAATHAAGRHACPHCAAQFRQPRYLRVHVRRQHPAAPGAGPSEEAPLIEAKTSDPNI